MQLKIENSVDFSSLKSNEIIVVRAFIYRENNAEDEVIYERKYVGKFNLQELIVDISFRIGDIWSPDTHTISKIKIIHMGE